MSHQVSSLPVVLNTGVIEPVDLLMTAIFSGFGAVFLFQSVSFLERFRRTREKETMWCLLFGVGSGIYSLLFIFIYSTNVELVVKIEEWHFLMGYLTLAAYVKCLKNYYRKESRLLRTVVGVILLVAGFYFLAILFGYAVGDGVLFLRRPEPIDIPGIPFPFIDVYNLSWISTYSHLLVRLLVFSALVFLVARAHVGRDRTMQVGIILSMGLILHNFLSVNFALHYYIPLLPLMNIIEISRFEWMVRKGERLTMESIERQAETIRLGLTQHAKLKALGRNAAAILHDLSGPAQAIANELELIGDKARQNGLPELVEEVEYAKNANVRMLELLAAGKSDHLQQTKSKAIELRFVVEESIELLQQHTRNGKVIISVVGDTTRRISGDPIKISQAIVNIVNNAYDAISGQESPWIRIYIDESLTGVTLSIANSGEKIASEFHDKIFEPFFTTKSASGGSGIGLDICRRNLRDSNATLELNTESPQTQFDIVFHETSPLPAEAKASTTTDSVGNAQGRESLVMYIDDEKSLRNIAARTLNQGDLRVETFDSAESATSRFIADPTAFVAVVCDLNLPGMSGYGFAEKIVEIRPNVPIALITGLADDSVFKKAEAIGISKVFGKPILYGSICSWIRNSIDSPGSAGKTKIQTGP